MEIKFLKVLVTENIFQTPRLLFLILFIYSNMSEGSLYIKVFYCSNSNDLSFLPPEIAAILGSEEIEDNHNPFPEDLLNLQVWTS